MTLSLCHLVKASRLQLACPLKRYKMSAIKYRVMAVDDEPNILLGIQTCLPPSIYQVDVFSNWTQAYGALKKMSMTVL